MTRSLTELLSTLTKAEVARLNVPDNAACVEEMRQFRSAVRKIANVKCAQNSRKRRREMLSILQKENTLLRQKNDELLARARSAEAALSALRVLTLPM